MTDFLLNTNKKSNKKIISKIDNRICRISTVIKLGLNDFKAKYAGSFLGIIWAVVEPFVTVLIYWFVYTIALKIDTDINCPYYLWLAAGLSGWLFVSEGIKNTTAAFRDYSYLVKKTGFDKKSILSLRVLSSFISHIIFLGLIIILTAVEGMLTPFCFFVIFYIIAAYLFVYSTGGIAAVLCTKYKDVQNIVNVFMNILFWLTPVFWSSNIAAENTLIANMIKLNPIALIVNGYRDSILYNRFSYENFICIIIIDIMLFTLLKVINKIYLPNIADNL